MHLESRPGLLVDRLKLVILDLAGLHRAILQNGHQILAFDVSVADVLVDGLATFELLLQDVHV